jgi:iron complex outermembrane receptor protein
MNAAPGLHSGNLPGSIGAAAMRGFHRSINYLYDGVRLPNSDVLVRNWDSWAFERIEVIKGPSSVTSGEGALAGAVNFVPRRPQMENTSGEVLVSQGSQDTLRLGADLNLPLGIGAAFRTTGSFSRSSGWVDDTDSEASALGAALLLEPNERLSVTLSADYAEDERATAYYGTPLVSRAVARNPSSLVSSRTGLVLDEAMRDINFNIADGGMDSRSLWTRAKVEYSLSDSTRVVSDTSWYDGDRLWRDSDEYTFNTRTNLIDRYSTYISHAHEFWSERLHLENDSEIGGRRNRLSVGLEFGGTDFYTVRRFGSMPSANPFAFSRGVFPTDTPANFSTRQNVTADIQSRSFFLENAFNVTPDLLLVGGLRKDDITFTRHVLNATSGVATRYGQDYDPVTWRLGSVYTLRPETQLFAQYTRAVSPLSGFLFISAANSAYDLTTGESTELGLRHSFASKRLHLTASVFDIAQDDILTRDPANANVVLQGGRQVSRGAEMSLNWLVTDELGIMLSGTVLEAQFEKLIEAGGVNRSGNRPLNVPESLVDISVTYSPASLPISVTGIVRHNGNFYTSNANVVKVDGFTVFDAAVAWESPVGTLTLRGRNLTDEFYVDWSGYSSGLVFVGEPRSAELTLNHRF